MSGTSPHQPAIRPAHSKDFDELQNLLNMANDYALTQSGVRMWANMGHAYSTLRAQIEAGEFFVVRDPRGAITSAIALADNNECWEQAGIGGSALYFMKLMKDPAKALPGEGLRLLGFAAAETLRQGKTLLRCDTLIESGALVDYYRRLGFQSKGTFMYESTGRPAYCWKSCPGPCW
ncbi:MAG TPA: hypothetical protein VIJ68_00590 [Candidatus Saccharimonadales bacterium]